MDQHQHSPRTDSYTPSDTIHPRHGQNHEHLAMVTFMNNWQQWKPGKKIYNSKLGGYGRHQNNIGAEKGLSSKEPRLLPSYLHALRVGS